MSPLTFVHSGNDDEQNITVFFPDGGLEQAHSSHPNFQAILAGIARGDESVRDLFDLGNALVSHFEGLTERVSLANGQLYFDGDPVDNALTQQALRFLEAGVEDYVPLLKFYENVQNNPNEHSREQLYTWLAGKEITITDEGLILGYKGVRVNHDGTYASIHQGRAIVNGEVKTGNIPNRIGDVVEMPRSEVQFDPSVGCHTGLHVGNYQYANNFAQGKLLTVLVNPRDVVSVPTDSSAQKMRVCRYEVFGEADQENTSPLYGYLWDGFSGAGLGMGGDEFTEWFAGLGNQEWVDWDDYVITDEDDYSEGEADVEFTDPFSSAYSDSWGDFE